MTSYVPITLEGANLNRRHRHLNFLVNEAYNKQIPFSSIQDIPEQSSLDRIFKIDLASKYQNIDYVIQNLKDEDMLYVSRALKCIWILNTEYSHIFNPKYLEDVIFPSMITTAVNKTLHFIQNNLKDPQRCLEFYQYYKQYSDFNTASKFLLHCSEEFIASEISIDILLKLSPKYIKILSERCSSVLKLFSDNILQHELLKSKYLNADREYYNNFKKLLKLRCDIFLDMIEKYYNEYTFKRIGPRGTKFIMKHHKTRFMDKPELYTFLLLHKETLGKYLNNDEIKEVVIKLAKAEYLQSRFSYKSVEPLIKCLKSDDRILLKNKIFVEKSIGEKIREWPYTRPAPPERLGLRVHIFDDKDISFYEDTEFDDDDMGDYMLCSMVMKRSRPKYCYDAECIPKPKTVLDQLFDQYRFMGFDETFQELQKKIKAESSQENRQFMMLVLVSKSAGQEDNVLKLIQWIVKRHSNEPANVRATIVRSLVKRAKIWRLSSEIWRILLEFARDLGLDGAPPDAACREGVHAAILRDMLSDVQSSSALLNAFYKDFSTLLEYSLSHTEQKCVRECLPKILLNGCTSEPASASDRLNQLIDTLEAYHLNITECEGAITIILSIAQRDIKAIETCFRRLYTAKKARRQFFKENFTFFQTNESYLNALRHDADLLNSSDQFQKLIERGELNHVGFLKKVSIYFNEPDGLATKYREVLDRTIQTEPDLPLARHFAVLSKGNELMRLIKKLDIASERSSQRRFASSLRANAHLTRPRLDIDSLGWEKTGAKAVANKVMVCSAANIKSNVEALLKWKRTMRLALILSQRGKIETETFVAVATMRPLIAVKVALKYFRRSDTQPDHRVWLAIKPHIENIDLSPKARNRLAQQLSDVNSISPIIKSEYCIAIFAPLKSINRELNVLQYMGNFLFDFDKKKIINILENYMLNEPIPEKFSEQTDKVYYNQDQASSRYKKRASVLVNIMSRLLLTSESEDDQKDILGSLGKIFFKWIESLWELSHTETKKILDIFINALRYNKAFFGNGTKYVSVLPALKWVVIQMQSLLPIERYFSTYSKLHLIMLYSKAIRQCIIHNASVIADESKRKTDGVDLVGAIFGQYLAHEVTELMSRYFKSSRNLFADDLISYLHETTEDVKTLYRFAKAIVKGYIEIGKRNDDSLLVAQCIYQNEIHRKDFIVENDPDRDMLINYFKQSGCIDLQFFLHSDNLYMCI